MTATDLRSKHFHEIRETLTGKREKVYLALYHHGPCTAKELAAKMNWDKCSVRPRVSELIEMFHAQSTGERRDGEHVFRALTQSEAHLAWARVNQPASNQLAFL